MPTNKTLLHRVFVVLAALALFVSGCAKPAEEAAKPRKAKPQAELVKHSKEETASQHELVGIWLGKGTISQESFSLAIDGLSAETKLQLTEKAEAFLATEMAIEFKDDGTMESAIEVINQLGKRESGVGIATWEAERTVNRGEYRVSAVEEQADGSKVTDHKIYRVSSDGQQLELLVDLEGLLGQCNPRIVLQRQNDEQTVAASPIELR